MHCLPVDITTNTSYVYSQHELHTSLPPGLSHGRVLVHLKQFRAETRTDMIGQKQVGFKLRCCWRF